MEKINFHAPNVLCICVDKAKKNIYSGRLYCCFKEEAILFGDVSNMLLEADNIFDIMQLPEAAEKSRSFFDADKKTTMDKAVPIVVPELKQSQDKVTANKGKCATFILLVQYRQNSTWQGKAICVETNEEHRFVSELEFLKIVDNTVNKLA